ncbi:MAG: restriction endonuclease subunit S [Deltaproteobacteria bacterium]|nr:restriction endonuclease subunit S [Deltaproteobacteria bacterium]
MSAEWPIYKALELQKRRILYLEDGNHGEYRPRPNEFGNGEVAFIRASDMNGSCVDFENADRINNDAFRRIRKGIGKPGDVIFSHKGTVGKLALMPLDAPPFVCSPQTTFWRTLDENLLDRRFLYYYMTSKEFIDQWFCRKGETDMADYVSLTAQRQLYLRLPEISEQHAIISILAPINKKIELNRQMNITLEQIAQALFKSWFIYFDPVVAKVAGKKPFGMSDEVAALFPDKFEESEIGPVPAGWSIITIKDLARYVNGKNFTKNASNKGRLVIRIAELNSGPSMATKYNDVEASTDNTAKPGDLLFSWSGSLNVYRWYRKEALINQHIFKVIPTGFPQWFVHFSLIDAMPFFQGIASGKATTMGHIKREHLNQWKLVIPPDDILDVADNILSPPYLMILQNERESFSLTDLRDSILPKLLSGQIRLKQVEKIVSEAF